MAMVWQELYGNWVLVPPRPIAIVHFLGGAFVATAPQVTYRNLLEHLANEGYLIIATPFINTLDHTEIAARVLRLFNLAVEEVLTQLRQGYLPIFGLGHSMGCKLHLLIGSLYQQERAGNILISFNNYPAKRSIPLVDQFSQFSQMTSQFASQFMGQLGSPQLAVNFDVEFTPSPEETQRLIAEQYPIKRNLLVKFNQDNIDQTRSLYLALQERFPDMTTVEILTGNHLTPLGQDVNWRSGKEFSPLDAIGQFMRQEFYRDLNQLKRVLDLWLNPTR